MPGPKFMGGEDSGRLATLDHGVAGGSALWLVSMAQSGWWWEGMGEPGVWGCSPSRVPSELELLSFSNSLLVLLLLL